MPVKCTNLFLGAEMSNVITEIDDPVAIVRLNRPEKLNAFTFAMIEEIRSAVNRAATDDRVVGIVITGNGRAFSAGLDAGDLRRSTQEGSPPPQTPPEPDELPAGCPPWITACLKTRPQAIRARAPGARHALDGGGSGQAVTARR